MTNSFGCVCRTRAGCTAGRRHTKCICKLEHVLKAFLDLLGTIRDGQSRDKMGPRKKWTATMCRRHELAGPKGYILKWTVIGLFLTTVIRAQSSVFSCPFGQEARQVLGGVSCVNCELGTFKTIQDPGPAPCSLCPPHKFSSAVRVEDLMRTSTTATMQAATSSVDGNMLSVRPLRLTASNG